MKDFVYLPPMWWFQYSVGAYMALMSRLVTARIPQPVLDEDNNRQEQ